MSTSQLAIRAWPLQKKVAREIAQQMSDAFKGRNFVGVVNGPHLGLAHKPGVEPWVQLAAALGR
jgi:hypothetical protein